MLNAWCPGLEFRFFHLSETHDTSLFERRRLIIGYKYSSRTCFAIKYDDYVLGNQALLIGKAILLIVSRPHGMHAAIKGVQGVVASRGIA